MPQFLSLFEWNANDTFSKPAYVGMHGKLVEALLPGTGQADAVLLAEVGCSTTPHPHPRHALRRTCAPCSFHGRVLPRLHPQRDWAKDSGGEKALSRQQAWDSIFQLIDIWTTSADAAE